LGAVEVIVPPAVLAAQTYSHWETFWYVGGFVVWAPAYIAIVVIAVRQRRLEIPVIAVTANVTWEFLWGFVFRQNMGPGLQWVYRGACILDLLILLAVFRLGRRQSLAPIYARYFNVVVVALLAGWIAFYWSFHSSHYDLPLGSMSAYLDNILMSGLYIWFVMTRADPRDLSFTVAWSKGLGTAMVSVFVFMEYPDNAFIKTLAVMVGILDFVYLVSLAVRLRQYRVAAPSPELVIDLTREDLAESPSVGIRPPPA
jgi:hypothetical protein